MIYYSKAAGAMVVTEPRPWARSNPQYFSQLSLPADGSTTSQVVEVLKRKGFMEHSIPDLDMVIIYSFASDPGIQ